MKRSDLQSAVSLAKTSIDLSAEDISVFDGFGLREFRPVFVTLRQLAALVRWQCFYIGGGMDQDALAEIAEAGRTKFTLV